MQNQTIEVTFTGGPGGKYQVSYLTLSPIRKLEGHMVQRAQAALARLAPGDVMRQIEIEARGFPISDVTNFMQSFDGAKLCIVECLKEANPTMTHQQAMDLVGDDIDIIASTIRRVRSLPAPDPQKPPAIAPGAAAAGA